MSIDTCARGVLGHAPLEKMIKIVPSGAFWVFESMLLSTYKSTIFRMINQQPKFCATYFSKIYPDAQVSTKINTFRCYKGNWGGGGAIASEAKEM